MKKKTKKNNKKPKKSKKCQACKCMVKAVGALGLIEFISLGYHLNLACEILIDIMYFNLFMNEIQTDLLDKRQLLPWQQYNLQNLWLISEDKKE